MATLDETFNNGQQAFIRRNTANIFVWNNRTTSGSYTATEDETLLAGTLMGRISATGAFVACDSAASDGSQYPLGFVLNDHIFSEAGEKTISIVISGDVVETEITLAYGVTLDDVVDGRQLRDHLLTGGIKLVGSDDSTDYDNE
jgi:hypothetical protein